MSRHNPTENETRPPRLVVPKGRRDRKLKIGNAAIPVRIDVFLVWYCPIPLSLLGDARANGGNGFCRGSP